MMSKSVMSLAFAAGCALAIGAMPAAHAQYAPQQPYTPAPQQQPYMSGAPQQQDMGGQSQLITNGPQASAGDLGDWSARRNVRESANYDRLLESSPGFRRARMTKECGPIGDQQLHQQCMSSFGQFEPTMYGSSQSPWRYQQNSGQ